MSHEQKPHHHHHSHGRRNWLLPMVCITMIVGGGYWMNSTSSDPDPQPPAAADVMHAVPPGPRQADASNSTVVEPEPGMESVGPSPAESPVSGIPAGMGTAEPGVGTMSTMGPSRIGGASQTMKR